MSLAPSSVCGATPSVLSWNGSVGWMRKCLPSLPRQTMSYIGIGVNLIAMLIEEGG